MGSSSFRTWPSKNIFPALYILPLPTTETWLFHADTQALSQFICDSCPDSLGEEVRTFLCIDTFRLCDSSPICLTSTFANVKSLFWPLSLWASYWIIPYLFSLSLSLSHTHTHTINLPCLSAKIITLSLKTSCFPKVHCDFPFFGRCPCPCIRKLVILTNPSSLS
jgi:hypothetical protein